jgi:hypothetical protein
MLMKSTGRVAAGLLSLAALVAVAAGGAAQAQTKTLLSVARFSPQTVSAGKLKQGTPARGTFTVINIGTTPLVIERVQAAQGCSANYTQAPIEPGKHGSISVSCSNLPVGSFNRATYVEAVGVNQQMALNLIGQVSR